RGAAKFGLGNLEGAILDYNKAIQIDPENANAYSNRAGLKSRLGESETANGNIKKAQRLYEAAVSDATQAIQINPEHAGAYNNRGHAKEALGQKEAAKVDFQKAKELDPDVGQ
ncbi:tetratricopeptide repeat protein, partial [Candidatus Poribacteria bacterium]|nr:tetratricopeptide repeat protein [Candidatus Poribacteria bacterium]